MEDDWSPALSSKARICQEQVSRDAYFEAGFLLDDSNPADANEVEILTPIYEHHQL